MEGIRPKAGTTAIVTTIVASNRQTDTLRLGMAKRMHLEVLNLPMRF
jgi:hypothetical protein